MAAHDESSKHHPRSENETGRGGAEVRGGGCLYDTESGRGRDEERRKERESESETPVCLFHLLISFFFWGIYHRLQQGRQREEEDNRIQRGSSPNTHSSLIQVRNSFKLEPNAGSAQKTNCVCSVCEVVENKYCYAELTKSDEYSVYGVKAWI